MRLFLLKARKIMITKNIKHVFTAFSVALFVNSCKQRTTDAASVVENFKLSRPSETLISSLNAGKTQQLLVVVKHDAQSLGLSNSLQAPSSEKALTARTERFRSLKQAVINAARTKNIQIDDTYSHLPILKVSVSSVNDLSTLANDSNVVRISEQMKYKFNGASNLNLIRQPEAASKGFLGAGTSVAVLDSGLDYKRAAFGPCTAVNTPADKCRVAYVQDFAPADNTLDDSILHGTNVAGIVASVAPGAKILGLDVFDGDGAYDSDIISAINWVIANKLKYNIASMNMSFGSYGPWECNTGAISVAISTAKDAGILSAVAAGNTGASIYLDYPGCTSSAVSVGAVFDSDIGTVDFDCVEPQVSAPDKLTCFSSFSTDLKLVAPGVRITAAGVTMTGTSQATPHVAGAIAVLKSAFPNENPDQFQDRLTGTGKIITPPPGYNWPPPAINTLNMPRLDLAAALGPKCQFILPPKIETLEASLPVIINTGADCKWAVSSDMDWVTEQNGSGKGRGAFVLNLQKPLATGRAGTLTITGDGATVAVPVVQPPDTKGPQGTFSINGTIGNKYTSERQVTLVFDVRDISGVDAMCVSNTPTCSSFVPFSSFYRWNLSGEGGPRTVYVYLRDKLGNTTQNDEVLKKSIILDTTPPTGGRITIEKAPFYSDKYVTATWDGFIDNETPIETYAVVYSTTKMPSSCMEGNVIYQSYGTGLSHGPLDPGTHYYRVCATNAAKLMSDGVTTTYTITPRDLTPPEGTVKVNADAPYTRFTAVTLSIKATDPSGVTKMCISTDPTCTKWEKSASSKGFTLPKNDGLKTVNVWLEDGLGNRSLNPVKDTIILDTVPPSTGKLSGSGQAKSAVMTWAAGSDVNGVAGYKLVYKVGSAAPKSSCTDGTVVTVAPGALTRTVTSLSSRTVYSFRVCAIDLAGNVGAGTTASIRIP